MKRLRLLILLAFLIPLAPPAGAAAPTYIPGEILVKFKPGTPTETIERLGARLKTAVKSESAFTGVRLLSLPPGLSVDAALSVYRGHPDVLYAEPNYTRRAFVSPDDTSFDKQWGLRNTGQAVQLGQPIGNKPITSFQGAAGADIDAPDAWDYFLTRGRNPGVAPDGTPIIVAVLDSGVDYVHPDLSPNIWTNPGEDAWKHPFDPTTGDGMDEDNNGLVDDWKGWNFIGTQTCTVDGQGHCDCTADDPVGNNDPMDDNGHGTHVAGIAAARGNNNQGIAGILWNAQIMPLKMLDANGCGSVGNEIRAIDYAIQNGARVINASFGAPGLSSSEEDAIRAANEAGVVFVAAAGNDSSNNDSFPIYPASFDLPNVISVAATDWNDRLSSVSNFGKNTVDVAAPGDCIYSTTPTGGVFTLRNHISCLGAVKILPLYGFITGTSMAAPHVAGVAGMLLAQNPNLSPAGVRATILLTVDPLESLKGRVASSGRVNANNALLRAAGSGLTGGKGGCGVPIGAVRSSRSDPADSKPVPPAQALLFLLVLFWPLAFLKLRKKSGIRPAGSRAAIRRPGIASAGPLVLVLLWPQAAAAADGDLPFQPVHSLALKLGYHRYAPSDYLHTNSGLISRNDLAGFSGEIEYDRRWRENDSLSVTAGHIQSDADLKNLCCGRIQFSTFYLLVTPKLYSSIYLTPKPHSPFGTLEGYVGGGVGYYHVARKVDGVIQDNLSQNLLGLHAVLGLEWPARQRVTLFTEGRYALARVKSADAFDDALDVGGLNFSFGVRWRFSPSEAVVKPSPPGNG
ncbi:MAG TPA: S8 family peptidase [Nitrospiria bacterium]|nr:S8 family peptidase [Nitrospiria bacterium]